MTETTSTYILASPPIPDTIPILGMPVHRVDMQQTMEILDDFIRSREPHHVVTADASMLVTARDDRLLQEIICSASLVTPDSAGVLWAAKRLGGYFKERVSGVDIVDRLAERSALRGYRLYFLGAAPGIAQLAADRLSAIYPGAQIVGSHDGFYREDELQPILDEIVSLHPDVLCVAMGIPKQEKWIARHREALNVPVMIGVGGTFDVLSGQVKRAPILFRKLRLEWLWRVVSNPRKIRKVALLPRFVIRVLQNRR